MYKKFSFAAVAVVALLFFAASCSKEKDNSKYFDQVSCNEADDTLNHYDGKIKTILNMNCAKGGCHDAASHEEGINLSNYASAVTGFKDNALCTIYQDAGCKPMPEGSPKMSDATIHDLTCWAKNGYPQ
ncbi:MAG: hypothetical protein U0T75_01880 [Chitinophagales bacterium]